MTGSSIEFPEVDRRLVLGGAAMGAAALLAGVPRAWAAGRAELNLTGKASLQRLYASNATARAIGAKARAILIFPKITKGGFVIGGQGGQGVLFVKGVPQRYFRIVAGSFGLQAGIQNFSYALFFMSDAAMMRLKKADGWALGTDPNIVLLDKGAAAQVNTTSLRKEVYVVPFAQTGLMAGVNLEGSKITEIHPGA
jgi:lipid-binding SYLF domain-containing protein